ncbi:MAG: hypothetical protein WCJ56_11405 [bacterium]
MTENQSLTDADGILVRLVTQADVLGASVLEIEYSHGKEEVCAIFESMGIGIASLPSSGDEAVALRDVLYSHRRKPLTLTFAGQKRVKLTVKTYDSFGETAYRVTIHESA